MNEIKEQSTESAQTEEHKCACGCGENTNQRADGTYSKYVKGHQFKGRSIRKENPELNSLERPDPLKEEIEPPKEPEKLTVTDLREYHTDDVAWFQVEENKHYYLTIDYIGRINDGTYSVLVRTAQGVFVPPYLIPGFLGIASVDMHPETQAQQPETEPTPEPIVQEIDDEKFEHIVAPAAQVEKKRGFLGGLFDKKEVPKAENPKLSGENLAKMIKQI